MMSRAAALRDPGRVASTLAVIVVAFAASGCTSCGDEPASSQAPPPPPAIEAQAPALTSGGAPAELERPEGDALARSPDESVLFVADEDRSALGVVPWPFSAEGTKSVPLPGRPAQVVTDGENVWVTVRDPGLLWVGRRKADRVDEVARIALPDDAWGLVLGRDRRVAYVSSAWSHRVSRVDLEARRVVWSVDVPREPRGLVLDAAGENLYASHLVGPALTRIRVGGREPVVERLDLPSAPYRSAGARLGASLGYTLQLSPSGRELYAARHALGARGKNAWFGAATVDVWLVDEAEPSVERPSGEAPPTWKSQLAAQLISGGDTRTPGSSLTPFTQPRAMAYRKKTDTLLVLGEGDDRVAELDARAIDPTLAVVGVHALGEGYHHEVHVASRCAAPTGLVLSRDEERLWVFCRASHDLVALRLGSLEAPTSSVLGRLDLGPDPLGPGSSTGRKLFYGATDHVVSGGLGCAGCHPEGRDDGHVWHEATFTTEDGEVTTFVAHEAQIPLEAHTKGVPRRTPMIAGRVAAEGPYGWHAESPTLSDREVAGFRLHRWGAPSPRDEKLVRLRSNALADFLRRGLVTPPRPRGPLPPEAERGRALFLRADVACADCHPPDAGFTIRRAFPLALLPLQPGFDVEEKREFKVPSLTFLAGRAPYFHDGSAPTLEALIESNGKRMGNTEILSAAERADLIAYLRTL